MSDSSTLWVGGYSEGMDGTATGITVLKRSADGSVVSHGIAAGSASPAYLAIRGDVLYAVGEEDNTVSEFKIRGDELQLIGIQRTSGSVPCALAVTSAPTFLVTACYGDGVVDVRPVPTDGVLLKTSQSFRSEGRGPHPSQDGPHPHSVLVIDDSTVLVSDLGADLILVYSLTDDGLVPRGTVALPGGTGPRDLFLHPSGIVWVLGSFSHEIFALARSGDGFLQVGSARLSGAMNGDHASGLAMSSDGKYAYSALRGSNRIAIFSVELDGARLTPIADVDCGGGWPRHIAIDGAWLHVANQLSNSVVTFGVGSDGMLTEVGTIGVPSPTFVLVRGD